MNTMKRLREQGLPKDLALAAEYGLDQRAELARKGKPIHGLGCIENPDGEAWLREKRS